MIRQTNLIPLIERITGCEPLKYLHLTALMLWIVSRLGRGMSSQNHYFSGVNIFQCLVAIPPECLKQFQGIHQSWFSWFCWVENVFLISWYFLDILENVWKVLIFCRFLVQKQRDVKLHSSLDELILASVIKILIFLVLSYIFIGVCKLFVLFSFIKWRL